MKIDVQLIGLSHVYTRLRECKDQEHLFNGVCLCVCVCVCVCVLVICNKATSTESVELSVFTHACAQLLV